MIKAEQAAAELDRRHEALARALEQLTGMSGLKYAVLELPDHFITGNEKMENPDLQLFDIRSRQLELSKNLLKSQRMPRLFGFMQPSNNNNASSWDRCKLNNQSCVLKGEV